MRYFLLGLFFLSAHFVLGQSRVDAYQNILVPSRFDFQKKDHQYNLNVLTKMYLEKYGFKAYLDQENPPEILRAPCQSLYVSVAKTGNFMKTKMQVFLLDCQKDTLYKSAIGISKEKDFNVSYNLALRQALHSLERLNYHYAPSAKALTPKEPIKSETLPQKEVTAHLYTAHETVNGYELLDKEQKVFMKLLKTSRADMFTAFKSGQQGVLILKNNTWFFEYYASEQLISEPIDAQIPHQ